MTITTKRKLQSKVQASGTANTAETAAAAGLLTAKQAAAWLAVSEKTLWLRTAPRGPIAVVNLSDGPKARKRYRLATLQDYAAAREKESIDGECAQGPGR